MLHRDAPENPAEDCCHRDGRRCKGNLKRFCSRKTVLAERKQRGKPFFFGPLQMTASSGLLSRKPTDITPRLSSTNWRG